MKFIKKFIDTLNINEGAYMYPIIIKREPQIKSYEKEINLGYDSTLTLEGLREYGVTEDDSFQIIEEENSSKYILYIYKKRVETTEEVDARVAKEEQYMRNYTDFHKK